MGAAVTTATGPEAESASVMAEDGATAIMPGTEGATAKVHCFDALQLPPSSLIYPGYTTTDAIQLEQDEEVELNNEYNSQTDLSQKELVEDIKNWLEKSVERRIKRRTTNKRKRKSIKISEHRRGLVKQMGFEDMLELDDCNVPRLFAQWITNNIKPEEGVIRIGENSIPINPKSFQDVLGIPACDLPVETDEKMGKVSLNYLDYLRYHLSDYLETRL